MGPPLQLPRARNHSAPSSGNWRRPGGGQDLYPRLLGRSAPKRDGSLAWGDGPWNGSHGLLPDGIEITLRVPLKRAPRVGCPWAGCRAWARSALVEASDPLLTPLEECVSRGNRAMANNQSPLGRARSPALFAAFAPELNGLLAAQLPAVPPLRGRLRLQQGDWFAWQQFAADDLPSLAVEIPANRAKPPN